MKTMAGSQVRGQVNSVISELPDRLDTRQSESHTAARISVPGKSLKQNAGPAAVRQNLMEKCFLRALNEEQR
jgi:hypothetical protein